MFHLLRSKEDVTLRFSIK